MQNMSEWESVKILKETRELIHKNRGDLSFGDYIHKCVTENLKLKHRIAELETELAKRPITSDVPLGEPQNPEKQKALEQLKKEKEEYYEVTELPLPPCNFSAKGFIDHKRGYQVVFCGDSKKYKSGHEPVPLTVCQKCWERKEWGKEKREREQEETPAKIATQEILRWDGKQALNPKGEYYCWDLTNWFKLDQLPCTRILNYKCEASFDEARCKKLLATIKKGDVDA